MFFHLFPQPLLIVPARHKVPDSRQQPPEESHDRSSAFTSKKPRDDRRHRPFGFQEE
jgi:hypothetical protein